MRIRLFVSGSGDRHAYDRRMIAALTAAGHDAAAIPVGDAPTPAWESLPPDAVAVIDAQTLAAFLPLADTLRARRTAVLVHHPSALEPGLSAAEQAILPNAARILAASEAVAARLIAVFGIAATQIAIVPPGVDPAPRGAGSGAAGCAILSIGALVPRKGHDVLLRALARLTDLRWRLTIVGTPTRHPDHAKALRALAIEGAIDARVDFIDGASDAALAALWQGADVFALATQWEATPGPIAEALRRGIPVAVCDGGAAAALVTPQVGAVVPTGDADALSRALRRMIFDTGLRAEMAEAAWQLGADLPTWPTQAALFVAALA